MEKFKILNERRSFYQWDYNQKLAVLDDAVTQVHFPLGTESCPPLPVYEHNGQRVVDVPNILLQTAGVMRVYAFVEDEFGGRTICTETFRVYERTKPDDYVYTETELWSAEKAVRKALQEAKDSGDFTGPPGPKGDPGAVKYVVVTQLPQEDTENAIYLVPVAEGAEDNLFDEYIYVDGEWEKIGSSTVAVNLDNYVKNTDAAQPGGNLGLVLLAQNPEVTGLSLNAYGYLALYPTTKGIIAAKTNNRVPVTPSVLDYAVKVGMTTNTEEWTEEEKQAARDLVGAVGNADYANTNTGGVVRVYNPGAGVSVTSSGYLYVNSASNSDIDAKANIYCPIVPTNLDYAVKVGVTTNTIALTDEEKAAACGWMGTGVIAANEDGTLSVKLGDGSMYKVAATKVE